MKANELRIGNWVMGDSERPYQIELSDFSDWYNDHNSHEYGDHVHPISITEEWLLKLGLEQPYDDSPYIYTKDIKECPYEEGFRIEEHGEVGCYMIDDYYIKIKYIHQLQNLYYALTGEELIVS